MLRRDNHLATGATALEAGRRLVIRNPGSASLMLIEEGCRLRCFQYRQQSASVCIWAPLLGVAVCGENKKVEEIKSVTVRQFIAAVADHGAILDMELRVGAGEGKITGGQHDGAVRLWSGKVTCALLGESGLLLFAGGTQRKREIVLNDLGQLQGLPVAGNVPDDLRL